MWCHQVRVSHTTGFTDYSSKYERSYIRFLSIQVTKIIISIIVIQFPKAGTIYMTVAYNGDKGKNNEADTLL